MLGCPTNLNNIGQGHTVLSIGVGVFFFCCFGLLDFFSPLSFLFLSLSLSGQLPDID